MNKHILLTTLLLLTSCTVGPDYKRPNLISDKDIAKSLGISNTENVMVNPNWHTEFADKELNFLVHLAMINNPDIYVAFQRVKQARLTLEIQGVDYYPTFDGQGSYTKTKASKNNTMSFNEDYFQAGLDISWELDLWGKGRRLNEKNLADTTATIYNLRAVEIGLKAEVINTYISLRQAQEQKRLLQKNLKIQQDILNLTKDKAYAGLVNNIDLTSIEYSMQKLKMQLPVLKKAIAVYKNNLTLLTGNLPNTLDNTLNKTKHNFITDEYNCNLKAMSMIPAYTIRNRPDVMQAELNLVAKNAMIGHAIASLYPNLSFSGLFGFQSDKLSNLLDTSSQAFSLIPEITMPFLHWGKYIKNVELEKETTKQALFSYQSAILNAVTETKIAMIKVNEQAKKNQETKLALKRIEQKTQLTLKQNKAGIISTTQTLSVFQELLNAQTDLIQGNGQIYQAVVQFYKSIGY